METDTPKTMGPTGQSAKVRLSFAAVPVAVAVMQMVAARMATKAIEASWGERAELALDQGFGNLDARG